MRKSNRAFDRFQLNNDIRRAITIGTDDCFSPIPTPGEDDWLSIQQESGQTVQEFEETLKTLPYPR